MRKDHLYKGSPHLNHQSSARDMYKYDMEKHQNSSVAEKALLFDHYNSNDCYLIRKHKYFKQILLVFSTNYLLVEINSE